MARRKGFAHLHVHTVHSVLDGMTQHEEMCDEVLADAEATGAELAAIASTDHGTLSGTYKFSKMARKRGVTPLFGNEMYLANGLQEGARFAKDGLVVAADGAELDGDKADGGTGKRKTKRYEHITLLAETEEGWRNLIRINNAAQAPDAKWGKPRADIDLICRHSEGIIALTGCLGGPVLGSVARGDVDRARSVLRHMLTNGFDRDHLFLEIMEHGIPQEAKAMRTMLDLGDEFEISPVATNDAHFAAEGDAHAHEAWLCNATKAKFSDPDRWKFHGEGYWLRSAAEMRAIFDADERTQMACDNTLLIAERIAASGDIMTPSELRLPEFPVPGDYVPSTSAQRKGFTGSAAYLNDQIREGAIRRYGSPLPAEVRDRLTYEFDVIYSMGLGDYFLIVQDLIAAARREGIRVGPGRGLAAGCAISYCLDIVNIDPIRYNLLFERFLNPERIGMPDIDIDFESSGRDWAFGYLARRYGVERVARIGSFGVALSKGAIRAAARVLSAPTIGDDLSAAVPTNKNGKPQTFAEFMDPQNPSGDEFRRRVAQSDDHQAVAELAESWEGGIDKEGVHACGVIIGRDPLDGEVPLRDSKGFWVTQWDGKDLDALQFLKLDALALRNLDVVTAAERLIEQTTGERIDADNPSLDPNHIDPVAAERVRKTFELLQAGKTAGVFQLESGGITELCVQVGPTTLDDIAAIVALYRPGPLEAKMEERYALRKNGLETVDYGIFSPDRAEQSEIAKVLDETFGVPVYQEQLMRLGDVVAGFGPIERNRLQKAVSKKLQDEMAAVGELFIAGAMAERRNDDGTLAKMAFRRDTAEKVWAAIKGAGNYAFNASHSYAYGWVTYITAFVKANWPTQYGAALLSVTKKADKRHEMLLSLAAEGIAVVAPRINEALVETTVNDAGEVVIGMVEVRDVSRDDAEAIVAARDAGGPFTSLADFAQRCLATGLETRVKIGAFEGLIEAGAFDELAPEGRTNRMGMVLIARALGQLPDLVPFDCEWNHLERARREAHRLGVLISPNPTKYLGDQIRDASIGGIKASPLRKADEQRAGGEFTTAAIVSSWSEQSGHWGRRADVLLTGTGAAVRATIWDKTLHKLRAAGRIPEVGDLVLVKGKIVMRKARLENENGEMADGEAVADEKAEISVWEMQVVDVDGKHFDVPAGPPALHEHWFVRPDGFIDEPEPAPPAVEAPAAGELPFGDPDPVVTTEPVSEPQADPEPSVLAAAPDVATRPADRSVAAPASPFGELLEADPGVVELPWSEGEVDTIIVELAHGSLGASSSTSSALRIMRREVAAVVSAVVHLQRRPHSDGADIADEVRPLVDEMLAGRPVEVVAYDEPQPRSTWLVPADGEWGVAAQAWAEHLASPAPVVALAAPVADRTAA